MSRKHMKFIRSACFVVMLLLVSSTALGFTSGNFNPPGKFPISKDIVPLTICLSQSVNVLDYYDNDYTRLIEKNVGVKLTFNLISGTGNDVKQKMVLMINSGDKLPDLFFMGFSMAEAENYGKLGIFTNLSPYMKDAYYIKHMSTDEQKMFKYVTSSDKKLYALPRSLVVWGENYAARAAWINKNWLAKFKLPVPKTTDEFLKTMKTFVENDANGNGKPDEIGLIGDNSSWNSCPEDFIMNAFISTQRKANFLNVNNGKVDAAYTKPEWRAGLEYLKQLIDAKALSPLSFTTSSIGPFLASMNGDVVGALAADAPMFPIGDIRNTYYTCLSPLVGPNGFKCAAFSSPVPSPYAVITKDCKNPDVAFKMLDYMLSPEPALLNRYGIRGVNYRWDFYGQPLITTKDGKRPKNVIKMIKDIWGKPQKTNWTGGAPGSTPTSLVSIGYDGKPVTDPKAGNFSMYMNAVRHKLYSPYVPKEFIMSILYTTEENKQIADISVSLVNYVKQQLVAFATGSRPLTDAEWSKYLAELNKMGLQDYLKIVQTAYTRTMSD